MSKSKKKHLSGVVGAIAHAGKCHFGNVKVMLGGSPGVGDLLAGGWNRGANTEDVAVIDLTGAEPLDIESPLTPMNDEAKRAFKRAIDSSSVGRELPWLRFRIKDFGLPNINKEAWPALAASVSKLMDDGHSVLVACQGGHGRTGMVVSILCYLISPSTVGDKPVEYIRSVYCNSAVESYEQHKYVHEICGLPVPENIGYKSGGASGASYILDKDSGKWIPKPTSQILDAPPIVTDKENKEIDEALTNANVWHSLKRYNSSAYWRVYMYDNNAMDEYEIIRWNPTEQKVQLEIVPTFTKKVTVHISMLATNEEVAEGLVLHG